MRVALKVAYDGASFYGHQRQPTVRTVEGECLRALRAAGVLQDPGIAFFRSASRTDRGVSAVANVIAWDSSLSGDAVVGAFNDRARDVWAWAVAEVPEGFHPRHAVQRWYRYHLPGTASLSRLREAARLFPGEHDFRAFTSDPPATSMRIDRVDVARLDGATVVDVRAPSFRRGMVRRIVAAMVAYESADIGLEDIDASLHGRRRDFGMLPPEPLFLMDIDYGFPFRIVLKPKVREEWERLRSRARLGEHFVGSLFDAARRSDK